MEKTLEQIAEEHAEQWDSVSDRAPKPMAIGKRPGTRVKLRPATVVISQK